MEYSGAVVTKLGCYLYWIEDAKDDQDAYYRIRKIFLDEYMWAGMSKRSIIEIKLRKGELADKDRSKR